MRKAKRHKTNATTGGTRDSRLRREARIATFQCCCLGDNKSLSQLPSRLIEAAAPFLLSYVAVLAHQPRAKLLLRMKASKNGPKDVEPPSRGLFLFLHMYT